MAPPLVLKSNSAAAAVPFAPGRMIAALLTSEPRNPSAIVSDDGIAPLSKSANFTSGALATGAEQAGPASIVEAASGAVRSLSSSAGEPSFASLASLTTSPGELSLASVADASGSTLLVA